MAMRFLSADWHGDDVLVRFSQSRLADGKIAEDTFDEFVSLIDKFPRKTFLVDFSNVKFISSAALGMLIRVNKLIRAGDGSLTLINVNSMLCKVFELSCLDKTLAIQPADPSTGS